MTKITQEMIAEAGVVGAGGAGFPTHVKLAGKADTVVINAAECEPLLHKDKEVLRHEADGVIAGLADAMQLVGAARGIVGIKGKYTDVIEVLKPKLARNMQITLLADAYPSGDEFILVYDTLGRVIPPGAIPLAVGAVVMNVETALNVARAAEQPVTEKYLSVAGAVAEPVTLRVPVGVTLAECVAAAGGATIADPNYVVGGVMMGYLEDNHQALVDKTTGGVIVLPGDHVVVRRRRQNWQEIVRIGRSAATSAASARNSAPLAARAPDRAPPGDAEPGVQPRRRGQRDQDFILLRVQPLQPLLVPEDLDPKNVCTQNKRRLMAEKRRWRIPVQPARPELHMANRKAPTSRLMQKLGLKGFRNVGPMVPELVEAERVGIKLKQHIGAACEAAVAVGQAVAKGQVIGRRPAADGKPALGAPVHASIGGMVTGVRDGVVWIERSKS